MPPTDAPDAIARFRALLAHDRALQDRLAPLSTTEEFADAAIATGPAHGIMLDRETLHRALAPDPLGLGRWTGGGATRIGYPPPQWLPAAIVPTARGAAVNWLHFAGEALSEPFFETSLRRAGALPLNLLLHESSTLQSLIEAPVPDDALMPDGFIFHMSRCGSTLAAQMIAAMPDTIVVSEASPIDSAVQLDRHIPGLPRELQARVLRAIVAAFGRNRSGSARRYVVKLEPWHMMALPLFRAAFPDTPWAFLYRDPVEVMVSQQRRLGVTVVPGEAPPAASGYGGKQSEAMLAYAADVLGRICQAAADEIASGGGILVNYEEMPGAVPDRLLPHFSIAIDAADRAVMGAMVHLDVKAKDRPFTLDGARKRAGATPALLALVEQHMAAPYAALEALRFG